MNKSYKRLRSHKLYLLLLLGWLSMSTSSCITSYYTPDDGTFTGTTTYCQSAAATANNFNYSECNTGGTLASGVLCTLQWYYNTTGSTTIGASTALGSPISFTSSASGTGTLSYTPLTTTPGTFYYFAYITWGTGFCTSPFTSTTQAVTIASPPGAITAPPALCVGSSATLTVAGSSSGTWSSGATGIATISSAGVAEGVAPGPVVISYTGTGCGTSSTVTVNVVSLPEAITGASSVCVGATTTLSDVTTGGTWSSSATGIANIDPATGVVSGVSQGTATISYNAASGCSISTVFAVNASPGAITGAGDMCQGSSITLTDPATGGTWSSSVSTVATVTPGSGIVTGISPGVSQITYTNGCGTPATVSVNVNSLPDVITGNTGICMGSTSTLSDASGAGVWTSTATSIATVGTGSGIVSGIAAGVSTISYTALNGCAATTTVNVIPPLAPITGAPAVCQGNTIALGAVPSGGTWTSSTTSVATISASGGVVTGVSMGTTTVTYTAGVGCSATRIIAVNPRAPIVGNDSVCLGLSTFLTNIVGGGNWNTTSPAIATVVFDSGRVMGLAPGTTTITYTIFSTGCQSSVNFRVVNFPDAIAGVGKACPGTSASLSDATLGGQWSSANTGVATVSASGTVTGVSADTVSVQYTILPGCTVSSIVTINPLPAPIMGQTPVCPGTIDSLYDESPGGFWTTTTPAIATVIDTSGVTTLLQGGAAVIKYTLPTGCLRTRTLSVNPMPAPDVTYNGTTFTFYTPDIYVSYQWYDSIAGIIPGATSPNVAALYNEYYYVVVTDTLGCKGASAFYHYNPATAGVAGITNNNNIQIYPNPTSNVLYIKSGIRVYAVVTGIDGKRELEQRDAKALDISGLASGMYFITFYDDDNKLQSVQKFIKE